MRIRVATEVDLEALFEQQADPELKAIAEHPGRERDAFFAHMRQTVLVGPDSYFRVIDVDGHVAGSVVIWRADGPWNLGYVLGQAWWGRGLASFAVGAILDEVKVRPLFANVATKNVASQRVLAKSGFTSLGEGADGVDFRLD